MSEWKEYKLGDLLIKTNQGVNTTTEKVKYSESGIPVIRAKNIYAYKIDFNDITFVDENTYSNLKESVKPKKGDILYTNIGSQLGNAAKVEFENSFLIAWNVFRIQPDKQKVTPDFLTYLLNNPSTKDFIRNLDSSSTMPFVSGYVIEGIDFLIPSLSEQTQIASILSSLDDKIDLLHRQNKTLEQLAETIFRQWFVEEAEESWEVTTLEKHTEVFRGLSYKGSGLTDKGLGLPMHNLNSVYEGGGYKFEGIKFYKGNYQDRHLITIGDIIVTNTEQGHEFRLIGFPAIVPDSFGEKGLFSQHIYKLSPLKQTYLTREYIYYLLMTSSVREQIIGATNGSTVNMLAIDGLQRPSFKLPLKKKVITFTTIVKDYWIKKNVNQNQIKILTQLRDTLLPKLMSGEVRVI